jgi:hypothetical protein
MKRNVVVAYIFLYLCMWYLLLKHFPFPLIKAIAIPWILSGAAAICLSGVKKQGLLVSTLLGSLLGPFGVLMILLASPDFSAYSEEEKDREFYEKMARTLDRHFSRLIPKGVNIHRSAVIPSDLTQICGYFAVKIETETESKSFFVEKYIEIFQQIYTKFNKEYSAKFAVKYPGIEERIAALDKEAEKYVLANKAYVDKSILFMELGALFDVSLTVLAGLLSLVGLVGVYYLFFTRQNPPAIIEKVLLLVPVLMREGDASLTWLYIKDSLFFSGLMFGFVLLVGMILLYCLYSVELNIFLNKIKAIIWRNLK